ncbi:MAG: SBBP repeat-containing protein [Candidatus Brocadia sinica]|nr:SBBP repeat-containing protein [Candidatus Brocadia sinica]
MTSLLASTYLGGSGTDSGNSLAIGSGGNVYVTGYTYSMNFPTTVGAYDTSYNSGKTDVFISRLNSGLTSLLASTFLGGSDIDYGRSLAIEPFSGDVYVTGYTYSTNFPTTVGAYDTSYNSNTDVFVSRLNSGLTSLLASTYLGGSGSDSGYSLAIDSSWVVYVTGYTSSTDFPTTSNAYDRFYNGKTDVFVSGLYGDLTSLIDSTYLGGSGDDRGSSLAIRSYGDVYVTGYTTSSNFPSTTGVYDTTYNGDSDVFVSRVIGSGF